MVFSWGLSWNTLFALDPHRPLAQLHHTSWKEDSGLVGAVHALAQTQDGYLWVGTSSGLFRFDGLVFERYIPVVGNYPTTAVSSLLATPDGGLWIGFRNNVTFLKGGVARTYTEADGVPYGKVRRMARTDDGTLWAAIVGGLARFSNGRWEKVRNNWGYPADSADLVFTDRQGNLWVPSGNRMFVLAHGKRLFSDIRLDTGFVADMKQAGNGDIWISDGGHDVIESINYNPEGNTTFGTRLPAAVWCLLFDKDESLWAATEERGIFRIPKEMLASSALARKAIQIYDGFGAARGLSDDLSFVLFEDREGNIWVGTSAGLDRFHGKSATQIDLGADYRSLALVQNGELWALPWAWKPGINIKDRKPVMGGKRCRLCIITVDRNGTQWIAGRDSSDKKAVYFGKFSAGKVDRIKSFPRDPYPRVTSVTTDADGRAWLSIDGYGEYTLDKGYWQPALLPDGTPDLTPDLGYADGSGRVWLLYKARSMIAVIGHRDSALYGSAHALPVGAPNAVVSLGREVWVGGDEGLAFFNNGLFHRVIGSDGDLFEGVTSIVPTARNGLWLLDAKGVVHITREETVKILSGESSAVPYQLFDARTDFASPLFRGGLIPDTVGIEATDGKIWFLTKGGVASLDPTHLEHNDLPPPVSIRSITVNGNTYSPMASWKMKAPAKDLSFAYTALSLTFSERNRFRYRLLGFDTLWHDAGTRRQAFYTNLPPGTYRFQVLASNNDGVWNSAGASLDFVVPPTTVQTAWFKVACLLAISLCIAFVFIWRMRLIEAGIRSHLSERLVERERIARELHDTLLQGFQGLILRFQTATNKIPESEPARAMMESALDRADSVLIEGRNRVLDLRSEQLSGNSLVDRLRLVGEELEPEHRIDFTVTVTGDLKDLHSLISDEAYWIGKEAIANALAHSRATIVEVQILFGNDNFVLRVVDNGVGIDDSTKQSGKAGHWGLSGMRERAEKINAFFWVRSNIGVGTEIGVKVSSRIAYPLLQGRHVVDGHGHKGMEG